MSTSPHRATHPLVALWGATGGPTGKAKLAAPSPHPIPGQVFCDECQRSVWLCSHMFDGPVTITITRPTPPEDQ